MQLLLPREVYKQQGINKEAQARTSPDWSPYITPSPEPVFLLTATSKLALMHSLGGLVHFDIQFLSTVHKSESTQAKGNMFLLKYQLVSGIPKDPKKLTYPSHKLQVTQVQALLKPDNKFTIFINIHSPPQRGGKLARLLSPN